MLLHFIIKSVRITKVKMYLLYKSVCNFVRDGIFVIRTDGMQWMGLQPLEDKKSGFIS